ncbi:hypothetical protein E2562_028457 [Oryza meyeriana var. granulata]|uniref:Uncharacterized protein n=1 Tax=Oryza meyeriana var. granulata TaxID=110450 RepID=A0A6G1E2Z6_9ORYZ|nr:hypothetical protein E2562_028457 [Oryza meyeriana var. granulata]
MGAGLVEDDNRRRDCLDGHPRFQCAVTVILTAICLASPGQACWASIYGYKTPEFSVKVPGVEGLERGPGAVAAPVFNVTLRVINEATRRPGQRGGSIPRRAARPRRPPGRVLRAGSGGQLRANRCHQRRARDTRRAVRAHGGPAAAARARVAGGAGEDGGLLRPAACDAVVHGGAAWPAKGAIPLPVRLYGEG